VAQREVRLLSPVQVFEVEPNINAMYYKSLCYDKLELIRGMIEACPLTNAEAEQVYLKLNDISHEIDEYIDRNGVRDRKEEPK